MERRAEKKGKRRKRRRLSAAMNGLHILRKMGRKGEAVGRWGHTSIVRYKVAYCRIINNITRRRFSNALIEMI